VFFARRHRVCGLHSLDPRRGMQEALAAGDVDAMRLLLLAQAQPVAVSPAAHPPRQHDMLTARADSLANSLLSRGLTTLERAEAASASRAPEPPHAQQTVRLPDLGLEIVDSPVMGQTIWPAALALCRWLKDHPTRVRGAHVRASRLSPAGEPSVRPLTSCVSHITRALTSRVATRAGSRAWRRGGGAGARRARARHGLAHAHRCRRVAPAAHAREREPQRRRQLS
jgi:hypothetical protein